MRRTACILIRLTDEERAILDRAAHADGLGLGPWLRQLGLRAVEAADRRRAFPVSQIPDPDPR